MPRRSSTSRAYRTVLRFSAKLSASARSVANRSPGNRIPVGIVRMHADPPAREGEVGRIRLDLDVEDPPVVRLTDVAEQVNHSHDRPRRRRNILDQAKAQITHTDQPVAQLCRVSNQRVEITERQTTLPLVTPQRWLSRGRSCQALPPKPRLLEGLGHSLGGERHRHAVQLPGSRYDLHLRKVLRSKVRRPPSRWRPDMTARRATRRQPDDAR